MFSVSIPILAASSYYEEPIFQKSLNVKTSDVILYDSCELEKGTMYLKETSVYRIVYIVFDDGHISYAICYKDNPKVSHTGYYYPDRQNHLTNAEASFVYSFEPDAGSKSIVDLLLTLEPESTINFAARATTQATTRTNTITTEAAALQFAEDHAPGWKTPVNSRLIGRSGKYSVTVDLYEDINGYCTEKNVVNYYINDTLASLASLFFNLNLTKIKNVVTYVLRGTSDYVAQKNGTLSFFDIDNTGTKTARIEGKTWYWSGWDRTYYVYSGDKATKVERTSNLAHPDYNNDITYFAEKAYSNYSNQ